MKYEILGKYGYHDWEVIDEAENVTDANYLVQEYAMAYGSEWRIRVRKVRV